MCGRYVVAYDPQTLVTGFSLVRSVPFPKRWNAAPMSDVPVVYETREGERVAETMRWGLLPSWAKEPALAAKLNNARAETVAEKPSFRQALRRRRCILPASGYYEWQTRPGPSAKPVKQPWYITPRQGEMFAMAGLFEAWRPPGSGEDAPWLLTCCVITTEAGAELSPIHDRMPVMLRPDQWAAWLARGTQDPAPFLPWLQPAPSGFTQAWAVSREVNQGRAEGPQLIEPIELNP